ncbi:MAG: two-component system LytT family response regulator [Paraglaciecola sp.]|jgi:two-component system LytT family response regulator
MLKVLIADDERIARDIIALLLSRQTGIETIEEARDGAQVLEKVQQSRPDIIFMDIQMPGTTGIQLAKLLDPSIVIVFVTAYDEFALAAFELNATDYLLKPFEDKRFFTAWERAKKKVLEKVKTDYVKLAELVSHMKDGIQKNHKSRLLVKEPGRIKLIDVEQINFITGAGNYVELHLFDDKVILHRETLTVLEGQLDPALFIRIHRSSIVRLSSLQELQSNDNGDYTVVLKSGDILTLSRSNKIKLNELLNETNSSSTEVYKPATSKAAKIAGIR